MLGWCWLGAVVFALIVADTAIANAINTWRAVEKLRANRPGCSCSSEAHRNPGNEAQ